MDETNAPRADGARTAPLRSDRLAAYERSTAPTLTVLAVLFLLVYGAPVVRPDLPAGVTTALGVANVAIWLAFAVDLAVRVWLAEHRVRYLARHPVDVLAVALPMLRPLRVLRVFTAGHAFLTRGRGLARTGQAVVLSAAVLVLVGALAVLDAESTSPEANITSFADGLWWAMTTVTTVGYGDLFPVTTLGRAVAASLMVVGISLLGVVTASVAAWFVADAARDGGDPDGPTPSGSRSAADRLDELAALAASGRIDDDEHAQARARVLRSVTG